MSDKILKIIEEGGDQLQFDAAEVFKKNGWDCQLSPYYKDISTDKSRELDIIARKEFVILDSFYGRKDKFLVRLFIECKYIKNDNLFYFVSRNIEKAKIQAKDNGVLRNIEYVDLQNNHYFKESEVAKTWKPSSGRDDIYDAWVQSVHALIYYQVHQREDTNYIVDIPVVLLKDFDNLYKKEKAETGFSKIDKDFQIEIDYSYSIPNGRDIQKTFFVDIISFDSIDNFLQVLDSGDISILKTGMSGILFEEGRDDNRYRNNTSTSYF